jgi:radical SAM superfamily enzyme YgiQ (UPF0313 family)
MEIILVNPPSDTYRNPEEHLGLSYIKSFLARYGHDVEIIDGYLSRLDVDSIIRKIINSRFCKIVGISPYIDSLPYALSITEAVKESRPDIHICWGGHLATFSASELLSKHTGIDSIVRGEGEETFFSLVQAIESGQPLGTNIKGLATRSGSDIIISPPRDLIKDLDSLLFPDRAGSLESYSSGSLAQISGSRGCYGNCSFCSINSIYRLSNGRAWRGRSPENIVKELEYLYNKYGFDSFKFVDDSFFGPEKNWRHRGLKIAEGILKSRLKIRFRISVRANNVDEAVFQRLKDAGLYAVSIGIESGVQRILDIFNKGLSVRQNSEALSILNQLDIITLMGFIGFDPYITLEEISQNIAFLEQNHFALTDVLSKSLYVHADDAITKKLLADGLITGRDFPNYRYQIIDGRSALVLKMMEEWNKHNKDLYYKVSDPLTAPRRTDKKKEGRILAFSRKLRKIDLMILKNIVKMVTTGYNEQEIKQYLEKQQVRYSPIWEKISANFLALRPSL